MKDFNTLSIILSSVITMCLLFLLEYLLCLNYFIPTGKILFNEKLFMNTIENLPPVFYGAVILLNLFASFLGGALSIVIGSDHLTKCVLVGGIATVFMLFNLYLIPFPMWYKTVSIAVCVPVSYAGGFVTKKVVS